MNKTTPALRDAKRYEELLALTDRAQKGDKTALPALREVLKDPAAVDLLGGDLARQAQWTLINKFSGKNLLYPGSLTRKLDLLRAKLAGPSPTPLERLPSIASSPVGCTCTSWRRSTPARRA